MPVLVQVRVLAQVQVLVPELEWGQVPVRALALVVPDGILVQ